MFDVDWQAESDPNTMPPIADEPGPSLHQCVLVLLVVCLVAAGVFQVGYELGRAEERARIEVEATR